MKIIYRAERPYCFKEWARLMKSVWRWRHEDEIERFAKSEA